MASNVALVTEDNEVIKTQVVSHLSIRPTCIRHGNQTHNAGDTERNDASIAQSSDFIGYTGREMYWEIVQWRDAGRCDGDLKTRDSRAC